MESFHDRLKKLVEEKAGNVGAFETKYGLPNGAIGNVLKKEQSLKSDRLREFAAKIPKLNLHWLLTGIGPMFFNEVETSDDPMAETIAAMRETIESMKKTDQYQEKVVEMQGATIQRLEDEVAKWQQMYNSLVK